MSRSPGSSGSASVQFFTTGLTATNGFDYLNTNGLLVFADGELTKTFSVPIINDHLVEGPEVINLTLINPTGATLGQGTATLIILSDDAGFTFSSPTYSVLETGGSATINVLRLGKTNGPASVTFSTSDGTALAGLDYVFTSGVLNFADGQTNQTVVIPIIDDNVGEGDETVNLHLLNPTNGVALSAAVLTIVNDEDTLSFEFPTYSVSEGGSNIVINVIRLGTGGTNLVTVRYSTGNGTATAGLDYTAVSGTLIFDTFDFIKSFTIPIIDNTLPEGDQTVLIQLSNVTGGATLIDPTNAVLTILDNDAALRFSAPNYSVSEGGTNATITVTRVGALSIPLSVQYASYTGSNDTATAGANYQAVSGVLSFAPGVTNQSFQVPIIDDLLIEGNETLSLRLFNATPTNVTSLLSPSNAVLTIIDNDSSTIIPAGSVIVSESIPNGILDPNENVAVSFGLRNIGNIDTTKLVATLLPINGVTSPSGPTNYGVLIAGGATVSRTFSFTSAAPAGGTVTATLQLKDGTHDLGLVTFFFTVDRARFTFTNASQILIPGVGTVGPASPYPSTIVVSNVPGTVTNVTVTLYNLNHTYPPDLDILLAGPQTNSVILMGDAGGFNNPIHNVNLTFSDNASNHLTATDPIVSGTYLPNSTNGFDEFDPPAPPKPYVATLYSLCNGGSPNGNWSLFIEDDASGDTGFLSGGWSVTIETTSSGIRAADLSVQVSSAAGAILVNQTNQFNLAVTNHGPATATNVVVTDFLPAGATFLSSSGSPTTNNNAVSFHFNQLTNGEGVIISIFARLTVPGALTNTATVAADQIDLNPSNNVSSTVTFVGRLESLSGASHPNGQFQFMISGLPGVTVVIETSPNLNGIWTPISTNILTSSPLIFQNLNPGADNQRFYRARFR